MTHPTLQIPRAVVEQALEAIEWMKRDTNTTVPPNRKLLIAKLRAALQPQAAEHQPCPDGSPCKHGHWCTEVYCQGIPCFRDLYKAAVEPVAWAMRRADGLVLDVICPDEHESHEGEYTVPLYTSPPAHLHNGHDAKHWNLLAVQRYQENCAQQEAMKLALEALKFIKQWGECALAVEKREAAIAALEKEVSRV